jgi:hypothetical protein
MDSYTLDPSPEAASAHQSLETATFACHTNEAIFEEPAPEILLDLPHHEPRQRADGLHSLSKGWPVLGHDTVEDGLLWPMALVTMAFVRRAFGGSDGDRVPSRTWRICSFLNSLGMFIDSLERRTVDPAFGSARDARERRSYGAW